MSSQHDSSKFIYLCIYCRFLIILAVHLIQIPHHLLIIWLVEPGFNQFLYLWNKWKSFFVLTNQLLFLQPEDTDLPCPYFVPYVPRLWLQVIGLVDIFNVIKVFEKRIMGNVIVSLMAAWQPVCNPLITGFGSVVKRFDRRF